MKSFLKSLVSSCQNYKIQKEILRKMRLCWCIFRLGIQKQSPSQKQNSHISYEVFIPIHQMYSKQGILVRRVAGGLSRAVATILSLVCVAGGINCILWESHTNLFT